MSTALRSTAAWRPRCATAWRPHGERLPGGKLHGVLAWRAQEPGRGAQSPVVEEQERGAGRGGKRTNIGVHSFITGIRGNKR